MRVRDLLQVSAMRPNSRARGDFSLLLEWNARIDEDGFLDLVSARWIILPMLMHEWGTADH